MISVDLDKALLDADEVDDVMGTSGSEVVDEGDAPDDTVDADPPECHGLVYIAGEIEYATTDFTSMLWRIVGPEDGGAVVEMVAEFPSVAKADDFIDEQTTAWEACADEVITTKDKASDSTTRDRVTAVHAGPHTVTSSTVSLSDGMPCQHVLRAVSNIVLDVSACGDGVSDPAEAAASKIADKIQAG